MALVNAMRMLRKTRVQINYFCIWSECHIQTVRLTDIWEWIEDSRVLHRRFATGRNDKNSWNVILRMHDLFHLRFSLIEIVLEG